MSNVIAYYRVSTDRQRRSGLGIEAQRTAVRRFAGRGRLIAERTRLALAAKKATGARLGNPRNLNEAGALGRRPLASEADRLAANVLPSRLCERRSKRGRARIRAGWPGRLARGKARSCRAWVRESVRSDRPAASAARSASR